MDLVPLVGGTARRAGLALLAEPDRPDSAGADRLAGCPGRAERGRPGAGRAGPACHDGPGPGLPPLARLRGSRDPLRPTADLEPRRLLRKSVPGQHAIGGLLPLHRRLLPLAEPRRTGLDSGIEGPGGRDRDLWISEDHRSESLVRAGGGLVFPAGGLPDGLAQLSPERRGGVAAGGDVDGRRAAPSAEGVGRASTGGRGRPDAGLRSPGDHGACPPGDGDLWPRIVVGGDSGASLEARRRSGRGGHDIGTWVGPDAGGLSGPADAGLRSVKPSSPTPRAGWGGTRLREPDPWLGSRPAGLPVARRDRAARQPSFDLDRPARERGQRVRGRHLLVADPGRAGERLEAARDLALAVRGRLVRGANVPDSRAPLVGPRPALSSGGQ